MSREMLTEAEYNWLKSLGYVIDHRSPEPVLIKGQWARGFATELEAFNYVKELIAPVTASESESE